MPDQSTRVAMVVGARPQFIKAAPLLRELATTPAITTDLIHTGQHYDDSMSEVFFRELEIPKPRINLDCGQGTQSQQTARMMVSLEEAFAESEPDIVVVFGDTNSTLAAGLVAAKMGIEIAHVEAGLRSFDRRMPEEINRVLVDHLATLHFTPGPAASAQLRREGVVDGVLDVGDVMRDVFEWQLSRLDQPLGSGSKRMLVTIHRPSNTDDPVRLQAIIDALAQLAADGWLVRWPVHPRLQLAETDATAALDTIAPLGYPDLVAELQQADLVVTDSGGLQKEAYWAGVPCLTVRDSTEWVETVHEGWNALCEPTDLAATARAVVGRPAPDGSRNAYGGVGASRKVADALVKHLGLTA